MNTARKMLRQLGEEEVMAAVGVGVHSIKVAKRDNQFPASWFGPMERLCLEAGIPCPRDMFAFKQGKGAA